MNLSRLKSSRLLSGGTWLKPLIASALPRIAMIELAVMLRALAGAVAAAAPDGERLAAQLPGHAFLGVVPDRLLPGDPAVGHAVLVEREDQGQAAGHLRFLPVKSPTWIILLSNLPNLPRRADKP